MAVEERQYMLAKRVWPIDGFLLSMLLVLVLAWVYPDGGKRGGWMHAALIGKLGIALVFFLNGALLPFTQLKGGVRAWRSHLLVQSCTFLVFPMLGLVLITLASGHLTPSLTTGLFFLCALPSTVSSAVALTSAANGDVPVALFNSTLSSLLGVVLTPIWLSVVLGAAVLGSAGGNGEIGETLRGLAVLLVLPLFLGQMLRPWLGARLGRHKRATKSVDRFVILLLIYASFCDSFAGGVWAGHSWLTFAIAVPGAMLLFALMVQLSSAGCRALGLDEPARRAAVLCSSQKSLAVGVPMAQVFFGSSPKMGVILLPILVYHPLQLAVSGWLVSRWARGGGMPTSLGMEA